MLAEVTATPLLDYGASRTCSAAAMSTDGRPMGHANRLRKRVRSVVEWATGWPLVRTGETHITAGTDTYSWYVDQALRQSRPALGQVIGRR